MLARHDLVWLSAAGWQRAIAAAQPDQRSAMERWSLADWPLIVRRQDGNAQADSISLGLALPPAADSGIKVKIALNVPRAEVSRHSSPMSLAALLANPASVPETWRSALTSLHTQALQNDTPLFVYGSLALQALTGLAYVTSQSDIDLLSYPASQTDLASLLAVLEQAGAELPLDGEIVFPSMQAVAWKEWRQIMQDAPAMRILVKDRQSVRLMYPADLLTTLKLDTKQVQTEAQCLQ